MMCVDTFMHTNERSARHMEFEFELELDMDSVYLETEPEEVFSYWDESPNEYEHDRIHVY